MKGDLLTSRRYALIDLVLIPLRASPLYTSLSLLNTVITALMPLLQAMVTARFIDTALAIFAGQAQARALYALLAYLVLIIAYSNVSWNLTQYTTNRMYAQLATTLQPELVAKRARLHYTHVENNDDWDLVARTCKEPVDRLFNAYFDIVQAGNILVRVVSLAGLLVAQVWWAALAILVMSAPLFYLALKGGRRVYKASQEAEKHLRRARYYRDVLAGRDNVEERTIFGYADEVRRHWRDRYEQARKIVLKRDIQEVTRMQLSSMATVAVSLLIMAVLLAPLAQGRITVGMFMALIAAALNLVQLMSWQLSWTVQGISEAREYLRDLTAVMDLSEQPGALVEPAAMDDFTFESLEFRGVSFRYPGTQRDILKDFTLRIQRNLHYALVGVNGAGKTTVTKLLIGLYDNYEGEILLNGADLRGYTLAQRKRIFSVVFQDYAKYYISARENICLGDVTVQDEARMRAAAQAIGLDEAIEALPRGYDTDLGKIRTGGTDISGGQWQRVAIARTLYSDSAVRILDEPTAALDPVAESEVYAMFGRISTGKTTLFITHRLGATRLADQIVVVDGGRVAELGTHEQLMNRGGIYAGMFDSQRSWYQ